VNAGGGNHLPDRDWEDMPPPVENVAVQGQLQDLRYVNMGYVNMANGHRPAHEHRDHPINNYVGVALDVPAQAQAQAAPPGPVSTNLNFPYTLI
jgi:hypothetical protein